MQTSSSAREETQTSNPRRTNGQVNKKRKKRGMLFGTSPMLRGMGDVLADNVLLLCVVMACVPVVVYYLALWGYI